MPPRKKHDPDSDEDEPAPVAEDLLRQMASLCTLLTQQLGSSTPAAQPSPDTQLRLNLPVPTFSGYSDSKSAEHFLADLSAYQTAVGATDDVILRRVLPAALMPRPPAARSRSRPQPWYRPQRFPRNSPARRPSPSPRLVNVATWTVLVEGRSI
ncbi:uncharacterized protein LOC135398004 isoform X1 [Ornithodoros turicata]|uniref:uncharacterized protein LOC135398004 isoform X1 n=1 Tax=Ornithodoros turicata TaxID=34597 RepID=UPI00313A1DD2